ncbi:MAG: cation:proton antiporter [Desulfotignum sp.]|jgi:Kef-type K+ transport system membrane component KefB|nr:cation:proton antiporter [Desulfotignum sp.]
MQIEITQMSRTLLSMGGIFLLGFIADLVGRYTPLPRVTLLLLCGLLFGPAGLDMLPHRFINEWFPLLTHIALCMVGFLLGEKITFSAIRERGRSVFWISVGQAMGASLLVGTVLFLWVATPAFALIMAGIAPASAPAAIFDVVKQTGKKSRFTDILLGIVAIDDAWGLFIFSFLLAAASAISGQGGAVDAFLTGCGEVTGSILLGLLIGLPMSFLTGRIRPGEPTQAEALGLVITCAGFAVLLDLSSILSAMVMGSTVATIATHHDHPFNEINEIEWPFMILFFLLAGASLHIEKLAASGVIGLLYIIARIAGLYSGARLSGHLVNADAVIKKWLGCCLFPQAGVALGMALLATERFPELKDLILPVVIGSTVIFEIIGPVIARHVINKTSSEKAG